MSGLAGERQRPGDASAVAGRRPSATTACGGVEKPDHT